MVPQGGRAGACLRAVHLGVMDSKGQRGAQDYAEAVRWYRKAAEQGLPDAQFYLGLMYGKGQGVPQDYTQAHLWFNLAASRTTGEDQQKHAKARDVIADMMTAAQVAEAQKLAREWKPKSGETKR